MVDVLSRPCAAEGLRLAVTVAVLVLGCGVPLAGPMLPAWPVAAGEVPAPGAPEAPTGGGPPRAGPPIVGGPASAATMLPSRSATAGVRATGIPATAANLSAVIETARSVADVGSTVPLNLSITGGVPPYSIEWEDSLGAMALGPNWSLQFALPSVVAVSARVFDSDGSVYMASRALTIVAGPAVNVSSPVAGGDPGVPFPLLLDVSGGVPPYSLTWSVLPNGSSGSATLEVPTDFTTPVTAPAPGAAWATVTVTDADGGSATTTARVTDIAPPPSLILTGTTPVADADQGVVVSGLWSGGVDPVVWAVAASLPVVNVSAPVGTLSRPGALTWTGTFAVPGNATIAVQATDADGVTILRTVSIRVCPALTVGLSLGAATVAPAAPIPISAEVAGGLPPYTLTFSVTGGGAFSGNLSAAGPAVATLSTATAGFSIVSVTVRDALGVVAVARSTVLVSAAAPVGNGSSGTAAPPSAPAWAAWPIAILTIGGAVGIFLWPRLRRRRSAAAAPNALAIVRRLLEDGTPLDRETLAYLAEEEGSPPERTRAALERWERAGRVRSEPNDGGTDLLTWVEPAPPSSRSSEGEGA